MLYFSDVKNKKIHTEDNVFVGRLQDMIFLAHDHPTITKIVIRVSAKKQKIVPAEHIRRFDDVIVLKKNYTTSQLDENELFVRKNLLDNQIIDIAGDKMVRVNDVAIQNKGEMYIAGVDTSLVGILRWFGVEDIYLSLLSMFHASHVPRLLSWADIQTIELTRGRVKVKTEQTKLHKIRPEDLADYLEETNIENIRQVLRTFTINRAADVLNNLNLNYQIEFFKIEDDKQAAHFMSHMESEEATDILVALPKKKRERIIELLNKDAKAEVSYLLSFSHTPIGDILNVEYLTVDSGMSARQVIQHVRKAAQEFDELIDIYVLNSDEQLVGVFSLHSLLMQKADMPVYKFMRPQVELIHLSTPVSVVWKKLLKYKFYMLPVVDHDRHILGLVKLDEISEMMLGDF